MRCAAAVSSACPGSQTRLGGDGEAAGVGVAKNRGATVALEKGPEVVGQGKAAIAFPCLRVVVAGGHVAVKEHGVVRTSAPKESDESKRQCQSCDNCGGPQC